MTKIAKVFLMFTIVQLIVFRSDKAVGIWIAVFYR